MGKATLGKKEPDVVDAPAEEPKGAAALHGAVVTDSTGRVLVLRELGFLEQSRLVRLLGSSDSFNGAYMKGYVLPACAVASIDGVAFPVPVSAREVEAAIQRLDFAGFEAVGPVLYPWMRDGAAEESEAEALKNS